MRADARARAVYGLDRGTPEAVKALAISATLAEREADRITRLLTLTTTDYLRDLYRQRGPGPLTEEEYAGFIRHLEIAMAVVYGPSRQRAASGLLARMIVRQVQDGRARLATVHLKEHVAPFIRQDPELRAAMGVTTADLDGLSW